MIRFRLTGPHIKLRLECPHISWSLVRHATHQLSLNTWHYGAVKKLNFDFQAVGEKRLLQLNELEEIRNDSYEKVQIYKDKTKKWHDKQLIRKELNLRILMSTALQFQIEIVCFRASLSPNGQDHLL